MGYAFRDILLLIPTHILKLFVVHFLLKYLETFRDIGAVLCGGGGVVIAQPATRLGLVSSTAIAQMTKTNMQLSCDSVTVNSSAILAHAAATEFDV